MITVKHLRKVYQNDGKELVVLKDVNCEIQKGEIISIIGPSGTGKSTFLRCINRLEEPTSGEIIIDGENIFDPDANLPRIRQKMGMVFQNFNLFNHLTIMENLMVGPMKLLKMSKANAEKQGLELLQMVGLADKANAMPSELSGGQKQRVAIARCLSMKPEIILFDEPTSALDPTMVSEVLSVIKQLAKQGMTMAIVTHEMKFARDVSTRIFFMCEGIIYEDDVPNEIFDNPKKPLTKAFINKIRTLEFKISDKRYDLHSMNGQIDTFCRKYSLSDYVVNMLQLILEELLENILPFTGEVVFDINYSEKDNDVIIKCLQKSCKFSILSNPQADELAVKLITGYCESITEDVCDDDARVIIMKLKDKRQR